jgi:hypothetical protein
MTPIEPTREGGIDELTAALMRSEAEKNARLRQAVMAYEGLEDAVAHLRMTEGRLRDAS